jgi:hypothetical protein
VRLIIFAETKREFWNGQTEPAGKHSKHPTLDGVSRITAEISRDGNAGNPRIAATINNENGQTHKLFVDPPLAYRAEIYDDENELVFAGEVDHVAGGETFVVQVQAS